MVPNHRRGSFQTKVIAMGDMLQRQLEVHEQAADAQAQLFRRIAVVMRLTGLGMTWAQVQSHWNQALVFRFIKFDDEGVRTAAATGVEGIETPAQHAS
jgi:hypothetical protein